MKQRAIIGALVLIGVGVALGATVFRTDIAQATGLKNSQSVIVDNKPAQPVPVQQQGTANVNVTNTAVSVAQQVATKHVRTLLETGSLEESTFPEIKASLLVLQGDTFGGTVGVVLRSGGTIVFATHLEPSERVVLPLPQLLPVDEVDLTSCTGRGACFLEFNIIGS